MIVKKFRIKNYKSIVDSGDCYLEETLTIFAGKNACGKTTILEALENFNLKNELANNSKIKGNNSNLKPEISITFNISPIELNKYYRNFGINKTESNPQDIEIKKNFPNINHLFGQSAIDVLQFIFFDQKHEEIYKQITETFNQLTETHNVATKQRIPLFNLNPNIENLKTQIESYRQRFNTIEIDQGQKITLTNHLSLLENRFIQIENNKQNRIKSKDYIIKLVPNFILFKSFNEVLPHKLLFDDKNNQNQIIQDLQKIIPYNFSRIKSLNSNEQKKAKDVINKSINEKYSKFWNQDDSKIDIDWDNDSLTFWIKNDYDYFEWSEESQGKQWHILFFIKMMSQSIYEKQNIILIDEPGSSLHATAQKDIYAMLLENSQKSQILFTTHSPYLIFEKELHRLRLVIKKSVIEGTKIQNKVHAGADKETLTPIMTAIGLSINEGIHSVDKHYNVIVEGMSDVYYLRAFSKIIGIEKYNFVYGGSSSKLGSIGSILNGWGCKTIYLLDNDKVSKKNDSAIKLAEEWHIEPDFILKVKDIIGTIEDVFTQNEYKEKVLESPDITIETTNGEYAKKTDKVLKAKVFLNKIEKEKIELEIETLKNINSLFKKFEEAFILFDK